MNWKAPFLGLALFTQAVAQDAAAPAAVPLAKRYPALRVLAKVGTKRNKQGDSSYMQTMTISPQVTIESAPTQPMAAAEAVFLIITMDTAKKYRSRAEECKVATNETVVIPAVEKGSRRIFDFTDLKTQFDSWRDGSNVGGSVYKYFVMAVRADNKELLYFETNCAPLQAYLQKNPDQRERFLALKKKDNFPTTFE